jgi:hypothetical protein
MLSLDDDLVIITMRFVPAFCISLATNLPPIHITAPADLRSRPVAAQIGFSTCESIIFIAYILLMGGGHRRIPVVCLSANGALAAPEEFNVRALKCSTLG